MTREEATTKLKWFLENNLIEDISGCEGLKEAVGMAIEALSNTFNVLNALDTISRQAAIDALQLLMRTWFGDSDDEQREVKGLINTLPSAQPEGIKYAELSEEDYEKMAELMRKQPLQWIPADPEVIRCKDCRRWHKKKCLCDVWDEYISNEDFYCGCAERRTDE